jgi:Ca2+-binding EF-hand superfamily protein
MKADAVKIFNSFDTDNDNKITKIELSSAFTKMGIKLTEEDKELIFTALDKNGDGYVVINEFCKWIDV